MKYALLMYSVEKDWAEADEATREKVYAAHGRFSDLLRSRDAGRGGEELALTSAATTVRMTADGEALMTDGPYAETAEQLGGFYLVEARDLDEALEFARALAGVEDIIEVRPVVEHPSA
ncbi:hypothetical protein JIG36_10345 [Actinoplanes sp. LDG1-06]|uniref:YCII-related domain-containing protein n=1 Tax=Paractinoplanes ovalisporus TaxID=2810368 RepID=A0ABS2A812_9ACTN|nr:YciI family protein [Actinoplanes ovalisporus]MBM2615955.1 hypothetical protein [Actinoplanes ovalisporus]